MRRKKKKVKLKLELIFCVISFTFILGCTLFYGSRFIYFYLDSNKKTKTDSKQLATVIINNNTDNDKFSNITSDYYFTDDSSNNYLKYSNILWRIVKIDKNNKITLISNDILTSLAYGKEDYKDSYINKWLNNDDTASTGILEKNLNNVSKYLDKIDVCTDTKDKINNNKCKNKYSDKYIGILNIDDYVNIGANKSYINNEQSFYLSGINSDDEVWVVDTDNKILSSDKEDIYGIKATIKLKSTTNYIDGDGSSDNPYTIESSSKYFGSYVDLDGDSWRIINDNDTTLDLIKVENDIKKSSYSTSGYTYNPKNYGSLAYYLNNTYLNSLTYKSIINEKSYANGYYGSDNDYNYIDTINSSVKTKVSLPNIGDIIFYEDNNDFMSMTGTSSKGNLIYIFNNGQVYEEASKNENNVLPVININKDILTSGSGSKKDPYKRS